MIDIGALELVLLVQALAIAGLILSRHHLRKRHADAKTTLNRVAGERDDLAFHGARALDGDKKAAEEFHKTLHRTPHKFRKGWSRHKE